jgi:hypothetical protein
MDAEVTKRVREVVAVTDQPAAQRTFAAKQAGLAVRARGAASRDHKVSRLAGRRKIGGMRQIR